MATTAVGIMQDGEGNGTSPHTLRKCIQARWVSPGIVCGLDVAGRNDLRYDVAAGVAVLRRSEADGCTEAYWEGGQTPAVQAGGSNPRIDLVWMKANDLQQGDPDNLVVVGVESGVPSASPVAPQCPAGCTPIALMRVPAGASSTASAQDLGDRDYAVPYGASMGVLARLEEAVDGTVDNSKQTPFLQTKLHFPTNRNITLHAFLCVSTPEKDGQTGVATCRFMIDGERYTTRKVEYTGNWVTYEPTTDAEVSAGDHTFGIVMFNQTGPGFVAHYGEGSGFDAGDNYVGRVLRIDDNGPAL